MLYVAIVLACAFLISLAVCYDQCWPLVVLCGFGVFAIICFAGA